MRAEANNVNLSASVRRLRDFIHEISRNSCNLRKRLGEKLEPRDRETKTQISMQREGFSFLKRRLIYSWLLEPWQSNRINYESLFIR